MDASEHLLVLVSIIIGLAITDLLTSVRQLVRARRRVRLHWLPLAVAGIFFLGLVQFWWAFFRIVQAEIWSTNFFAFLLLLLMPVLLYLATSSLLPDPAEMDETTSLLDYYMEGRVWVFGLLALNILVILLSETIRGDPPWNVRGAFRIVFASIYLLLAWSRSVRVHTIVVGVGLAIFLLFTAQYTLRLVR